MMEDLDFDKWDDKKDNNPFSVKNISFIKSEKPENCKAEYHNYGIRKYGFCANCNSNE